MTCIFAFLAICFGFAAYISHMKIMRYYNADDSLRINAAESETPYEIKRTVAGLKKDQIVESTIATILILIWLYLVLH